MPCCNCGYEISCDNPFHGLCIRCFASDACWDILDAVRPKSEVEAAFLLCSVDWSAYSGLDDQAEQAVERIVRSWAPDWAEEWFDAHGNAG